MFLKLIKNLFENNDITLTQVFNLNQNFIPIYNNKNIEFFN